MKNSIYKEKFTSTNFVKPLYRVKFAKVTPKLHRDIDRAHLVGAAYNVTNNVSNITFKETQKYSILPGACEDNQYYGMSFNGVSMEEKNDSNVSQALKEAVSSKTQEAEIQMENKVEETWLRLHPAPILEDEGLGSIIFRCLACQLGITVFIVVWTSIWVAVIQSYEGPHENLVNAVYEKQQLQLVIDLATELRTITPPSPSWKKLIFKRIEEARRQTMEAAERGARLEPGCYWDVAGTFLFTVYVMTALGFGAPVPQTAEGRCFALLYALFAIPFHVYLVMQASTCAVAHIDHCLTLCHKNIKRPSQLGKNKGDNQGFMYVVCTILHSTITAKHLSQLRRVWYDLESFHHPGCHRILLRSFFLTAVVFFNFIIDDANIEVKRSRRRKRLSHLVAVVTMGHFVPVVSLLYYAMGVAIFGLGRRAEWHVVDVMMFPLQFTTNGGLATVEAHYRVMYALYVEGAMVLLTCAIAAARRQSGNSIERIKEDYRLYTKR